MNQSTVCMAEYHCTYTWSRQQLRALQKPCTLLQLLMVMNSLSGFSFCGLHTCWLSSVRDNISVFAKHRGDFDMSL